MMFLHLTWLLAVLLLPVLWMAFHKRSYIAHSNVPLVNVGLKATWLYKIPLIFFLVSLLFLILALANPQVRVPQGTQTIKSRDILIAIDISGSMGMQFDGQVPKTETGNTELDKELPARAKPQPEELVRRYGSQYAQEIGKRRIDAAQVAVARFVRNRFIAAAGDRIGIMMFDSTPHWSWPLTDDLKMIYRKGVFADQGLGGGTNFGNIEPGPIDAAAEHFDERGQSASKVFIMITDGEDRLGDDVMSRLSGHLSSRNINFYLVSVGNKNQINSSDIVKLAAVVNGQVFQVQNAESLVKCFDSIDQMERSPVQVNVQATYETRFYYFAVAAILFCLIAALTEVFIVHP